MQSNARTRSTLLASLVVVLGFGLTACGGGSGVTQADVDAIRSQLQVIEQRLDDVDSMLATATNGDAAANEELVDEAHREVVDARALLANVLAELPAPAADPLPADPAAPADPMDPAPGTPDAPAF